MSKRIEWDEIKKLFVNPMDLIDVRAPIEFADGHIPGAINLPILNDSERALIGTLYKQQGREVAIREGYNLVSGDNKSNKLKSWSEFLDKNPNAIIYCFRGGQRSQITQKWLGEIGYARPIIDGGYKLIRQQFLNEISVMSEVSQIRVITGPTGSGKTRFLNLLNSTQFVIDLEKLAIHRGSAFGSLDELQPSQALFENKLAIEFLKIDVAQGGKSNLIYVEDESRTIGRMIIPNIMFEKMRNSEVVWLDVPFEERVENIFEDYIVNSDIGGSLKGNCSIEMAIHVFEKFNKAVHQITKKLGGKLAVELIQLIDESKSDFINEKNLERNKMWIAQLLRQYYDPLYLSSLERRDPKVLIKGRFDVLLNELR